MPLLRKAQFNRNGRPEKVQWAGATESAAGVTIAQGFVLLQARTRERRAAPDAGPVTATPAVATAGGK